MEAKRLKADTMAKVSYMCCMLGKIKVQGIEGINVDRKIVLFVESIVVSNTSEDTLGLRNGG